VWRVPRSAHSSSRWRHGCVRTVSKRLIAEHSHHWKGFERAITWSCALESRAASHLRCTMQSHAACPHAVPWLSIAHAHSPPAHPHKSQSSTHFLAVILMFALIFYCLCPRHCCMFEHLCNDIRHTQNVRQRQVWGVGRGPLSHSRSLALSRVHAPNLMTWWVTAQVWQLRVDQRNHRVV
jgi:hypothetical protein